jgi:glycosyltransferase involved in cell wall biosynthesis
MKLVEINTVCGTGSTGRIVVNIAETLRKEGADVRVIYGRDKSEYPYSFPIGSNMSNRFHGLLTRLFDMHGYGSILATKRLISFLETYDPSVIHLHLLHGYYLNYKMLFDYLGTTGKPVVWTMHDCWAFTGHCVHFSAIKCTKWQKHCRYCAIKRTYPSSVFFDNSKRNFIRKKKAFTSIDNLTIVTPSQWLADLIKKSFLCNYPIKVIHNGIDLRKFKPNPNSEFRKQYHLEKKIILLGVANGLDTQKGLGEYICLSRVLSDKYQIVLVGCVQKIDDIAPKIITIPRTESIEELVSIYSSADVLLNLTLDDNFPTVNIEAMACGIPVITYRTGGSPESINNESGVVIEQHDVNGILLALEQMQEHPFRKEDCRKQAEKYSMEIAFDHYSKLLNELAIGENK